MMNGKTKNKPDNVSDNPGILPYGSNIGAPAIKLDNIGGWKQKNFEKLHKQILEKYKELNNQIQDLVFEYDLNQTIYSATFNFEPVIGEIYHLYSRNTGENFLSLIEPHEWKMKFIASFKLNNENIWIKK